MAKTKKATSNGPMSYVLSVKGGNDPDSLRYLPQDIQIAIPKDVPTLRTWLADPAVALGGLVPELRELDRRRMETGFLRLVLAALADATSGESAAGPTKGKSIKRHHDDAVRIMRAAIAQFGTNAKPTVLIKGRISSAVGRNALRQLELLGEYCGFARKRPVRFLSH